MIKAIKYLSTLISSIILLIFINGPVQAEAYNCPADSTWFSAPSMPKEVAQTAKGGGSTFCDFYQFSWQAFAYLMSPAKPGSSIKMFQDNKAYYELEINSDGTPANSCDEKKPGNTLFVRITKSEDTGAAFKMPEDINQAGGGATIYDQNRNIVYYDVKFSKNMCNVAAINKLSNFPAGTTELKTAWKVLKAGEESNYLTISTTIGESAKAVTLGMIGFHMAIATSDHPEFVWATFEHNTNAPDCLQPQFTTATSFSSQQCNAALKNKDIIGIINCKFNTASRQTDPAKITSAPTEICREYAYGTAAGDLKAAENIGDITSLNSNVQQYLKGPYVFLNNYFNVGAIWLSNTKQDSIVSNQRGSLRLANTVAETEHQNVDLNSKTFVSNCFGCHIFSGAGNNTTAGAVSHIFDDILAGSGQCVDIPATQLINSQSQAESICPTSCTNISSQLAWNGQWTNKGVPMTVCGCCGKNK